MVASEDRFSDLLDALINEEYRSSARELIGQIVSPNHRPGHRDEAGLRDRSEPSPMAGKSIILGRGGSQVTADLAFGISIRLIAPEGLRDWNGWPTPRVCPPRMRTSAG